METTRRNTETQIQKLFLNKEVGCHGKQKPKTAKTDRGNTDPRG